MKKEPRSPRNWLILPLSFFLSSTSAGMSLDKNDIDFLCLQRRKKYAEERDGRHVARKRERQRLPMRRLGTSAFSWSNCVFQVLEKAHVLDATYFWLLWDGSTWRVYQFVGSSCLSVIIDASFLFLFFSSLFFFLPPSSTFPLCVQVFRGEFVQRIAFKESIFEKLICHV